jgi:hypothetical protein
MSDLLNKASLVMIPSGYKEDIVYSAVPSDGSGDLAFSRASNGTRVNSAGLVEVCPWNLLSNSENFSSWNLEGGTLTSGQTDPNGGTTAYKYVQIPGGGLYSGGATTADVKFAQVWIKSVSGGAITCNISDGSAFFGTLNVTGTWQLFTAPYTANSRDGIYLYAISNASGIYVWHPQLNIGSTAKPYFPTTDRLNVPRLTYQNGGGGCPSLLLEKQSTNLIAYSEEFDNAAWTKASATVSANLAISPDGTQNADLIYPTSSASNLGAYQFNAGVIAVVGTVSCYVKSAGKNWALLGTDNTSPYNVSFDLVNGVVGSVPSGYTATITSVGNGWFRITATFQIGSSLAYPFIGVADNTNRSVTADGTNGIYIWGFQAELSSYVTSYIPSTSASATRVQDICKRNISSFVGTNKGTIFWQGIVPPYTGVANYIFDLSDLTNFNLNRLAIYGITTNNTAQLYTSSSAGTSFALTYNSFAKIAVVWNGTSCDLYVNGTQLISGKNILNSNPTNLHLNTRYSEDEDATTQVGQVVLFNTNLSGAECVSLTTI